MNRKIFYTHVDCHNTKKLQSLEFWM